MKFHNLLFLTFFLIDVQAKAQFTNYSEPNIKVLTVGAKTSLRGLSVVNNHIIWVSGSNGKIGKSIDGGKTWNWKIVKGFEKTDFRDIEAFDSSTAIIIAIAEPAYILKTIDGGETWNIVYENKTKGMFLDAMDFSDKKNGIVIGDPIEGKFFIAKTKDGGNSWSKLPITERQNAEEDEACFASSGTNIIYLKNGDFVFVSGGKNSRFFRNQNPSFIPILKGLESTGANSVTYQKNGKNIFIVGGDFSNANLKDSNFCFSFDYGKNWQIAQNPPSGYRSCVEFINKNSLITCGINGVDLSNDGGIIWQRISAEGFHVVQKAKSGNAVFLAGNNGKIGMLSWIER